MIIFSWGAGSDRIVTASTFPPFAMICIVIISQKNSSVNYTLSIMFCAVFCINVTRTGRNTFNPGAFCADEISCHLHPPPCPASSPGTPKSCPEDLVHHIRKSSRFPTSPAVGKTDLWNLMGSFTGKEIPQSCRRLRKRKFPGAAPPQPNGRVSGSVSGKVRGMKRLFEETFHPPKSYFIGICAVRPQLASLTPGPDPGIRSGRARKKGPAS